MVNGGIFLESRRCRRYTWINSAVFIRLQIDGVKSATEIADKVKDEFGEEAELLCECLI